MELKCASVNVRKFNSQTNVSNLSNFNFVCKLYVISSNNIVYTNNDLQKKCWN